MTVDMDDLLAVANQARTDAQRDVILQAAEEIERLRAALRRTRDSWIKVRTMIEEMTEGEEDAG